MPVEVTAYRCQFRCRRRATTQLASIVRHEKFCLCDPKHKTCLTCQHNRRERDESGAWFECALRIEIPDGKQCAIGCDAHELR